MLPTRHRLSAEKDFARLFRGGRSFSGRGLGLKAARNTVGRTRVGFAIGVKVAKRAVARNLLKRRLREIVRKLLPRISAGFDLLFMARPGSTEMSFEELKAVVAGLLDKAGLITRS